MADTLGMFPRMKFCLGAFRWHRTRVALNSGSSRYRSREECTSYSRVLFARSCKIQCSANCVYGGWPKSIFSFQVTSAPLCGIKITMKTVQVFSTFQPPMLPVQNKPNIIFHDFWRIVLSNTMTTIREPCTISQHWTSTSTTIYALVLIYCSSLHATKFFQKLPTLPDTNTIYEYTSNTNNTMKFD